MTESQHIVHFDLETTGTSISKDRIVQISAIKTDLYFNVLEKKKMLINPTIPIPKGASDVHGITDEMVKDAKPFKSYAKGIHAFFSGCILSGYNIKKFDIPLLSEEFSRCGEGFDFPCTRDFIDGYQIFRDKEPRDLTAALMFYCMEEMSGAHDAENDVLATIKILKGQKYCYQLDTIQLVDFCKYDESHLDFEGKLILIDGVPCYNFGKSKGKAVKNDLGFAQWMLSPSQDFTTNTRNVLRAIINS